MNHQTRILMIDEPDSDTELNLNILATFSGGDTFYTRDLWPRYNDDNVLLEKIQNECFLYNKSDKINDDICCLCMDTLIENKLCFMCNVCCKAFCADNKECPGIFTYIKTWNTCPICRSKNFEKT